MIKVSLSRCKGCNMRFRNYAHEGWGESERESEIESERDTYVYLPGQTWTCHHVIYAGGSYIDTWTIGILIDMASEFWDTFLVKKYFCSAINFASYRVAKFGIWRKSSFLAVENTLIRIFRADAFQMLYILKTFELEFIIDVSLKVNLTPL